VLERRRMVKATQQTN